jgi:hypothetical protein
MTDFGHQIKHVVGSFVASCTVGYGTFVTIDLNSITIGAKRISIWVYLSTWAFLRNDVEIVATDMDEELFSSSKNRLNELNGRMIKKVTLFPDNEELHLDFSGDYRLEIWANKDLYGGSAALVRLFSDVKFIGELTPANP